MTLQILISTLDKGIDNVAQMMLPPHDGIGYLVSWQHNNDEEIALPHELDRNDVEVYNLEGRGISRNRNNCLRNASGDVLLLADDDCHYTHERLQQVIDTFTQNPNVDIATFQFYGEGSSKHYPTESFDLSSFPKGYFVSSIEIGLRRESVQGKLWFNENFGLGTEIFHCGEENIFIEDALALGLKCKFFPITIVDENDSSICVKRDNEPGTLMAHGAIIHFYQPKTEYLRVALKAYRLWRNRDVPFFKALKHMINGIKYAKAHPEIKNN